MARDDVPYLDTSQNRVFDISRNLVYVKDGWFSDSMAAWTAQDVKGCVDIEDGRYRATAKGLKDVSGEWRSKEPPPMPDIAQIVAEKEALSDIPHAWKGTGAVLIGNQSQPRDHFEEVIPVDVWERTDHVYGIAPSNRVITDPRFRPILMRQYRSQRKEVLNDGDRTHPLVVKTDGRVTGIVLPIRVRDHQILRVGYAIP